MALVCRFIIFKDQFAAWGEGLERIDAWEAQYQIDHPGATKAEMDKAFSEGIDNIQAWKENYKKDHPNATETEINNAFEAAWDK